MPRKPDWAYSHAGMQAIKQKTKNNKTTPCQEGKVKKQTTRKNPKTGELQTVWRCMSERAQLGSAAAHRSNGTLKSRARINSGWIPDYRLFESPRERVGPNTPCKKTGQIRKEDSLGRWVCRSATGRQAVTFNTPCKKAGQVRKADPKTGKPVCRSATGKRAAATKNTPCPKDGHKRKQDSLGRWVCRSATGPRRVDASSPCADGKIRALVPVKNPSTGFATDQWRCVKPKVGTDTAIEEASTSALIKTTKGQKSATSLKKDAGKKIAKAVNAAIRSSKRSRKAVSYAGMQ